MPSSRQPSMIGDCARKAAPRHGLLGGLPFPAGAPFGAALPR